jgi:hypothetical protein
MSNADFHNLPGWNRLPACCFGRPARNLAGHTSAIPRTNDLCRASHNKIRRDAGFNGRNARSTQRVIDFSLKNKFIVLSVEQASSLLFRASRPKPLLDIRSSLPAPMICVVRRITKSGVTLDLTGATPVPPHNHHAPTRH